MFFFKSIRLIIFATMSFKSQPQPIATVAAAAAPGLLTQVGMAGGAAVITVSFIHPIDVVKVRFQETK